MELTGYRVYGILAFKGFPGNQNDPGQLNAIPMVATINSKNMVYVQPGSAVGIKHFSIFAETEFNTSNYSIRSAATGEDFTMVDEIDPSSDYKLIKNYIDLVLEVEPNS